MKITDNWEKWLPIYSKRTTQETAKEMLTNHPNHKSGCEVWDKLSDDIVKAIANGETMQSQKKSIGKCMAHVRTCHSPSCVNAKKALGKFDIDPNDLDLK